MRTRSPGWQTAALLMTSLEVVACAEKDEAPPLDERTAEAQDAVFTNGNFESGTANAVPPSWTITPYLNQGVTLTTPKSRSDLQLKAGGSVQTVTLTGAPESQIDPALGAGASLRWPKYGNGVAYMNTNGTGQNTNSLKQQMTIDAADVDSLDGKVHVRFTVAPVLQNPGHSADQQPYYFVELRNVSRGTTLYRDYNASAQPGVPWKVSNGVYYTDWQLVDIAPGSAELALGDVVELEVIAAGCAAGGHFGRVYVDGVGSMVPGLFVSATGPASANAGSLIPYTLNYHNGGTGGAGATTVTFTTPPGTTFQSVTGATCTTPTVGTAGVLTCAIGTVGPGDSGTFGVTVKIDSSATGKITNGDYAISATAVSPLVGPKVYTNITAGVTYADLTVTMDNDVAGVAWGQPLTYQIVVRNDGPSAVTGATLVDTFPAQLSDVTWTCAASAGATCAPSGAGSISDSTIGLPVNGTATYTVHANVVAGTGKASLSNTATASLPSGSADPDPSNNAAGDVDAIGPLRTLTLTKGGTGSGVVGSVPTAISCGVACSGDSTTFVDGTAVILTATPAPGDTFAGWSGGCSGTGTCALSMDSDRAATATFVSPLAGNGLGCGAGTECLSGQCVDGVCCDTSCGGGVSDCQACNVAGSVGTCAPLPATTECRGAAGPCDAAEHCTGASPACPADTFLSGNACRASAGACDVAESCDGNGPSCPSDMRVAAGTICGAASCTSGVATPGSTCDGVAASCEVPAAVTCGQYVCGASACLTICASDAECASGSYCEQGACEPKHAIAAECSASNACSSGQCVDGVCCASACDGQCETCSEPGHEGACVAAIGAPRNGRPSCETDGTVCGGACNGVIRATCSFPSTGIECSGPSCASGVATLSASCDGAGACAPPSTQSCGAYECGASECRGDCTDDAQCATGNYCSAGICTEKVPQGSVCQTDNQCGSGACADGYCCNSSCHGQCEACDVAGSEGACSAVVGAPRGGRDACASDGSLCGGSCDGSDTTACAFPTDTALCREPSCEAGVAIEAGTCNGAGSCSALKTVACGAYPCDETRCAGDCTTSEGCVAGNYCAAGICSPRQDDGATCSSSGQCSSGACVDGVCCNTSCVGQCEACDVPGSEGTCSPSVGAPHGARAACAGGSSTCGGACDGTETSACAYPVIECRGGSCEAGKATAAAVCDGAGSCPAEVEQTCGPFACGATACNGDCVSDAECASGSFCSAGICALRLDLGITCGGAGECASGNCVDGVCCDSACDGSCGSCVAEGHVGTCSAIVGAPQGGRAACGGQGTCAGSCDGTTLDACSFPGVATQCGGGVCSAGVATNDSLCDGAGSCVEQGQVACGDLGCDGDVCAAGCSSDDQCGGGLCLAGQCFHLPILDLGDDEESGGPGVKRPPTFGTTEAGEPTETGSLRGGGCSTAEPGDSPWQAGALALIALAVASRRRRTLR